ncbi:hypothetical protein L249_0291 [Ophiocordyceps polyrhachis-furcata BCC 54312]|uniref:Uncharacterized protein n=1 Tax=Ophiocordyceps polyrhachis-furcata BCC 54312 TaxID=1330021 RepID=A0A367LDQ3_9HYPO|nr:hypothetical protein L249_0291 [Ophiocordyceps polyrhachis-furcata BCC 54312]
MPMRGGREIQRCGRWDGGEAFVLIRGMKLARLHDVVEAESGLLVEGDGDAVTGPSLQISNTIPSITLYPASLNPAPLPATSFYQ